MRKLWWNSAGRIAKASCICVVAAASVAFGQPASADEVSGACGHNFVPNIITIDGDVNFPTTLTVPQLRALPGQQTLNITFLNHLGVAQTHAETGPSLWNVLSVAAGGIKVPPPTKNQYVNEPAAQTTLYVTIVATDGYETVVAEAEIDPGFGNAPILLAHTEDGEPLSKVPYTSSEYKGPAQLVVPTDTHGGRYANQICLIRVRNGAL
jgi:hypothetical protein